MIGNVGVGFGGWWDSLDFDVGGEFLEVGVVLIGVYWLWFSNSMVDLVDGEGGHLHTLNYKKFH